MRNLITELCPSWRNIRIDVKGKYLGYNIGPGSAELSWSAPLRKFDQRASNWENKCGLLWNSIHYNSFVVTTLEFVAQLERVSGDVLDSEQAALRKFAPGPGTWVSIEDLENLDQFGIGTGFRTIALTAKAAKLRLMRDLGPQIFCDKAESIKVAQRDSFKRPFGKWHQNAFVATLCDNWNMCKRQGIQITPSSHNFQKVSRAALSQKLCPFDLEERIRSKMKRWCFKDAPSCNGLEDFFGTPKGMTDIDRLNCARRVRVTCRAMQLARGMHYDSILEIVHLEWNKTLL